MRYLKTFELYTKPGTGNPIDYEVGDIVVCIKAVYGDTENRIYSGTRYKVIKMYQLPEDKFLNNPYLRVDVENLETGILTKGWKSNWFVTEIEDNANKYNL